ncbi:MAG: hypothetical protein WC868_04100, partial [Bacteroidales bacterium]
MNKKTIVFIIIITSISLAGIMMTQLFWVKNALALRKEQFNHRVSIALKSVVNQLSEYKRDTNQVLSMSGCKPGCSMIEGNIVSFINPVYLDSVVRDEFSNMNIQLDYEYGIFRI